MSAINGPINIQGQNSISWTSATQGVANFSNISLRTTLSTQSGSLSYSTFTNYAFTGADTPASVIVNFTTTYATTLPASTIGSFSIVPFSIDTTDSYTYGTSVQFPANGTGSITIPFETLAAFPVTNYKAYGFQIGIQYSQVGGIDTDETTISGNFAFQINQTPVPEPGLILAFGAVALAVGNYRKKYGKLLTKRS